MFTSDFDNPHFLEPAHFHDPKYVSNIIFLPPSVTDKMSTTLRNAITLLEESTSIAYSSFTRLQGLLQGRFDHLIPIEKEVTKTAKCENIIYSEPAFFNYVSRLKAEKCYLEVEAIPDWRHKAARVEQGHWAFDFATRFSDEAGRGTSFRSWLKTLRNTASQWFKETENLEIPGFGETVTEFRLLQAQSIREIEATLSRESPRVRRRDTLDSGIGMESATDDAVEEVSDWRVIAIHALQDRHVEDKLVRNGEV